MKVQLVLATISLLTSAKASECVLVGYYYSGEIAGGQGFGYESYKGNDIGLFVDGELTWSYNQNHDGGNVAAICASTGEEGDKCRHGVEHNGNTFYYSAQFKGLSIRNCKVEWNGEGHWADSDGHCSVDKGYDFVGLGGGPSSSCGCKWDC